MIFYIKGGVRMKRKNEVELLETVSHVTQARPFSLHSTRIQKGEEGVLYRHWHPEMELWYLIEGEVLFFIEDSQYEVKAGEVLFLPPNLLHYAEFKSKEHEECLFVAMVFAPEMICGNTEGEYYDTYVKPVIRNYDRCVVHLTENETWKKECIHQIQQLFQQEGGQVQAYELTLRGYLLLIWQQLYNHKFEKVHKECKLGKKYLEILQVVDYMKSHYMNEISLKQLSQIACLSEGQFCRSFRLEMGETPFGYLNKVRIYKSCELLKESDLKITQIASVCGFNNVSYFNREFKRRMKITPSAYQKNQ